MRQNWVAEGYLPPNSALARFWFDSPDRISSVIAKKVHFLYPWIFQRNREIFSLESAFQLNSERIWSKTGSIIELFSHLHWNLEFFTLHKMRFLACLNFFRSYPGFGNFFRSYAGLFRVLSRKNDQYSLIQFF